MQVNLLFRSACAKFNQCFALLEFRLRLGNAQINLAFRSPCTKFVPHMMTEDEKLALQERIIEALKTVYDPEIPVNIYDLGLIYRIEIMDDGRTEVDMTLTAPNCPAADFIMEDVRMRVEGITGITSATINLVFEPEWDKEMMSEEAKLELGFL